MRIPVILVVAESQTFRSSALAVPGTPSAGLDVAGLPPYPGIKLDSTFAAVPLGNWNNPGTMTLESMQAASSTHFAIRGFVEVENLNDIPSRAGNAEVFADPMIAEFTTCGGTPPVGSSSTVASKLNVSTLGAKFLQGSDVALAIVDTGINLTYLTTKIGHAPRLDAGASWSPPTTPPPPHPGTWPVAHGTMCAFDVLIAAPQATLIDFPVLNAHYPGSGSTMSGTLSAAIAAYGFMLTSRATGALSHYRALVASNSWGIFHPSWDFPPGNPGRYCDNPKHPFNVQVAAATRAGIDILFAAGNCGAPCADGRCQGRTTGTIMGASAVQEVLTVAGCDTNDLRVGYSSQGPSIAGMYQKKPDITAYTHFLGSEVFGPGSPDSGTSAACPVAAGCVAALRSSPRIPPSTLPTAALFDHIRNSARSAPGQPAGWSGDYGYGIIDPVAAAIALGL